MSDDGLSYLPDEFRVSAQVSLESADTAESTRRHLRGAQPDPGSFGGADAFVTALIATRDRQLREVGQAAEGREEMAEADRQTADIGEEMERAADSSLHRAHTAVSRAIADQI